MSGINWDNVDSVLDDLDEQFRSDEPDPAAGMYDLPGGQSFDITELIHKAETIGNEMLADYFGDDYKFEPEMINLHSEMLSVSIQKNFSVEGLKNSPEYLLAAQTLLMGSIFYGKFRKENK